ncbi:MAG: histidine phosphatase family protein [Candidatus Omnitrophica bacterium]|nr:histidine phosphatase family protein [Candidatus Omnitrophota bacterium]
MPTRIVLIRHGETDYSLEKRYCGFKDVGLNNKGREQARGLYRRLRNMRVDRVYSSDSMRALHFAEIAFEGLHIETAPELREMNFGVFEGLTHEEIMGRYPEIYARWLSDPFCASIPEGDTLGDLEKRVRDALAKIISINKDKIAAVVTHAGPIKIIVGNILKTKDIWTIKPDLGSITTVEFKDNKGEIRLFNDTGHLNG